jgi:hypothetical protein
MDGHNSIFRSTTLTVSVGDTNELTPMMHSLTLVQIMFTCCQDHHVIRYVMY